MRTPRGLSLGTRTVIEQGLARGDDAQRIAEQAGCTVEDVVWVVWDMDRINAIPDTILPKRDKGLEQIAREETAAVYTSLVGEANSSAVRLAEGWTQWERHRLASAARTLRSVPTSNERDTA